MEVPAMLNEAAESAKNENKIREDAHQTHKRAFSAPEPSSSNSNHRFLDPPCSSFQAHASSLYSNQQGSDHRMGNSENSSSLAGDGKEWEAKCLFVENCDTGSVPRKAISHFFGRNKVCTRGIPDHVWVYYCRKHYQRGRYRNATEYAKRQCDLVILQLRRIHDWSDENKQKGDPKVLKDWTLTLRKREQVRLDELDSRKRSRDETRDVDDDNSTHNSALQTGHRDIAEVRGTAVPEWLKLKCGDGYTTEEMQEIMCRLKGEIEANKLTQIPDIELLPNIPSDSTDNSRPKQSTKKQETNGKMHKRSKSLGTHTLTSARPFPMAQPDLSTWRYESLSRLPPYDYPQTLNGGAYTDCSGWRLGEAHSRDVPMGAHPPISCPLPLRGLPSRSIDNSVHHPPVVSTLRTHESRTGENTYNSGNTRGSQYGYPPLPPLTHQRSSNIPTLSSQEQSVPGPNRPTHHTPNSGFTVSAGPYNFQANGSPLYMPSASSYESSSYGFPLSSHHHSMPAPNPSPMLGEHNWTPADYTYNIPERGLLQHANSSHTTPLPAPNHPYQYHRAPPATSGQPHYTSQAQISNTLTPEPEQPRSLYNVSSHNQAPPASNGYPIYTSRAQIPQASIPEPEQPRSLDNQAPPAIDGCPLYTPRAQIPEAPMPEPEQARPPDPQPR
ncbi:hypothetical protein F5Y14DRAFT_38790 [Nemania sp. NC0429]|nr:hypothetical protein F5Y14DRAFT_38790 [Nemania sp. NC0429]